MKFKVEAEVVERHTRSEVIEVDETDYRQWLEGDEHTTARLVEYWRAGVGQEFKDRLIWGAVSGYTDDGEVKSIEEVP